MPSGVTRCKIFFVFLLKFVPNVSGADAYAGMGSGFCAVNQWVMWALKLSSCISIGCCGFAIALRLSNTISVRSANNCRKGVSHAIKRDGALCAVTVLHRRVKPFERFCV